MSSSRGNRGETVTHGPNLANRLDLHDPNVMEDPHDLLREMRATCPVAYSDTYDAWLLTRYEDVFRAAQDWRSFTSTGGTEAIRTTHPNYPIIHDDPPLQQAYRHILNPHFSPQAVGRFEPDARRIVGELIDAFVDQGRADLAKDLATPFPAVMFLSTLVRVPEADIPMLRAHVEESAIFAATDPDRAGGAILSIAMYLAQLVLSRQDLEPQGDIVDVLLDAELDGRPLGIEWAAPALMLLVLGGLETTSHAIATSLWYLANHPEDRARLAGDFSLIPSAIEEFLRLDPPFPAFRRTVTQDTEVNGHALKKGDSVWLTWLSANHDEAEFPEPDRWIPDRSPNRHLAFGLGVHRCLGMHLARLELRVVLEEVLRRLPDFRVEEGARVEWHTAGTRGVSSLPVTFAPTAPAGSSISDGAV